MSFGPILQGRTSVFVGASFQNLEILKYACGLNLVPAATLNHNPIFEMASNFLSACILRCSRSAAAEFPMTGGWLCEAIEIVYDFTEDPRRPGGRVRRVPSYKLTTI
jgi:hypothetical protein